VTELDENKWSVASVPLGVIRRKGPFINYVMLKEGGRGEGVRSV